MNWLKVPISNHMQVTHLKINIYQNMNIGYNDHDLPLEKHALRIQLPIELFTYENVWKLYEYIMDRIDIPDTPPYIARFYEPEIRKVLNAPLE